MSKAERPWGKWYWADWRSDPGLRMCGYAARGLWMDLLSLMAEAVPFGHLLINGKAPTAQQLATMLGGSARQVEALLAELEAAGVPSRTAEGVLFSRRMVRDRERDIRDRENGRGGGNPSLRRKDKGGVNPPDKTPDKAQKPEARSQKPEGEGISTEARPPAPAREAGAPAAAADPAVAQVIAAFDEAGQRHFSPATWGGYRPHPAAKDHTSARAMLEAGADPALCAATFDALLAGMAAKGQEPPRTLSYARGAVSDALASIRQGLPPPRAPTLDSGGGESLAERARRITEATERRMAREARR